MLPGNSKPIQSMLWPGSRHQLSLQSSNRVVREGQKCVHNSSEEISCCNLFECTNVTVWTLPTGTPSPLNYKPSGVIHSPTAPITWLNQYFNECKFQCSFLFWLYLRRVKYKRNMGNHSLLGLLRAQINIDLIPFLLVSFSVLEPKMARITITTRV